MAPLKEVDILTVIRELEGAGSRQVLEADKEPSKGKESAEVGVPDPRTLLASLEKKRKFFELVDGHGFMPQKSIDLLRQEIDEKISFLENVIKSKDV